MPDSFSYCEDLVRQADKDRFLSALFAPADRRRLIHALYAFNVEIARVRDRAVEPLPGEVRLQWWREVLDGTRAQEARTNPVADALLAAIAERGLDTAALHELIDAHTFDLYDEPMAALGDLENYARATTSTVFRLGAAILDGDGPADQLAEPAGIAYGITALLRAFAAHASRRRLYVPIDVLARHGVQAEEVFAGHSSAALMAALADLRAHARHHLGLVRAGFASLPPPLVPALLPVALVGGYLDRMERRGYDPFATVIDVPQWRRQWVLWRVARRGIDA